MRSIYRTYNCIYSFIIQLSPFEQCLLCLTSTESQQINIFHKRSVDNQHIEGIKY